MGNRLRRRRTRRKEQARRQMLLPFAQQHIQLHLRLLSYWQASTDREGYESIRAAIVGIYRETGSLRETGRRMNFSLWTIRNKLHELGEPVNGPGGANNPYGRAGKPGGAQL